MNDFVFLMFVASVQFVEPGGEALVSWVHFMHHVSAPEQVMEQHEDEHDRQDWQHGYHDSHTDEQEQERTASHQQGEEQDHSGFAPPGSIVVVHRGCSFGG